MPSAGPSRARDTGFTCRPPAVTRVPAVDLCRCHFAHSLTGRASDGRFGRRVPDSWSDASCRNAGPLLARTSAGETRRRRTRAPARPSPGDGWYSTARTSAGAASPFRPAGKRSPSRKWKHSWPSHGPVDRAAAWQNERARSHHLARAHSIAGRPKGYLGAGARSGGSNGRPGMVRYASDCTRLRPFVVSRRAATMFCTYQSPRLVLRSR